MGQKVNTLGFRKGITNFWENSWYINNVTYNKNFFEDYAINLYLICLLKRLKIRMERCVVKQLNQKIYISFFYYRLYFIKIRNLKKRKRLRRIKKKMRYMKRFKKYKILRFKRRIKEKIKNVRIKKITKYDKVKKKMVLKIVKTKKVMRKYKIIRLLSKILKYFKLFLYHKIKQKRYRLINILNKLKLVLNHKKLSIFCINLNKFLLINIKKRKISKIIRKVRQFKKNRAYYDTIMVLNIALMLKNVKFFSDYLAQQIFFVRKRYPPYFTFLEKLLIAFKEHKYKNYVKGFRLRIGGKVKGRKKNRSDYFITSRGKLSLMSLNNLIYYSFSVGRTRFGILGIKFWVSYRYNGKLFKK